MRRAAQWERGPSDSIHIPSLQPVITGMPELCRAGLSENWLLKACGHRHWLALAQAHGMEKPDFRDKDDACIYPAFTHIHVADTWFDRVAENQRLDFALTLHRTGRTRFRSEIQVACDEVSIATLIMETTFVRRTVAGSNHGAVRAIVASPCRLMPPDAARRHTSTARILAMG